MTPNAPDPNIPLKCEVMNGCLFITIGIETLAWATRPANGGTLERCSVDPEKAEAFARDVAKEIMRDDEIGEMPITAFLDKMIDKAVDNGSEALIWPEKKRR